MKKVQLKEKIALALLVAMLVTNPLTGQYVLDGIEYAFTQLFIYGAYVSIVATVYLLGLGVFYYAKLNKVNIPAKGKNKTQQYIEA